jgi:hypothetical protein
MHSKRFYLEYFQNAFLINQLIANTYIYEIRRFVSDKYASDTGIFRAGIEKFYGSIDIEILLNKLKLTIKSRKLP